jgi:hypothetical protein
MVNQRRRRRSEDDDVVDLRGVEAGSGRRAAHLPEEEGPYNFVVDDVTEEVGNDSGKKYLNVRVKVRDGDYKGKVVYHNCSLQPKALFNLRSLMEACKLDAEKRFKIRDLIRQLKGKTFSAEVEDDEYNGKVKSIIAEFVIPSARSKRVAQAADDDDEEDEEDENVEDDEDEDVDEDDEDEEEEAPAAPARRRRAQAASNGRSSAPAKARAGAASRTRSRKAADDDEDDEDLDDIELDDL